MEVEEENTTQVSVAYIPQEEDNVTFLQRPASTPIQLPGGWFNALYVHMLIEDVSNAIMPFTSSTTEKPLDIRLQPQIDSARDLVTAAIPTRHGGNSYSRRSLLETVCDFVREFAGTIMYYGEVFFEIVYLLDDEDRPHGFRLSYIPRHSIVRDGENLIQELPRDVARRWNLPTSIILPKTSIVNIRLPAYVRRTYWSMIDVLARASDPGMREWAMQVNAGLRKGPAYDFAEHQRNRRNAVALATKTIGWGARQLINDDMLEHYLLQRFLRFEGFKIRFRDEILSTLNDAIKRAGQKLRFKASVVLDGFPKLADVKDAKAGLMDGSMTFAAVFDKFSMV